MDAGFVRGDRFYKEIIEPLKRGEADLVLGSRFKGEIKKGAMPWHHQYIGNPFLTWTFNKTNPREGTKPLEEVNNFGIFV